MKSTLFQLLLMALALLNANAQNIRIVTKEGKRVNTRIGAFSNSELFTPRGKFRISEIDSVFFESKNPADQKLYSALAKVPVGFTNSKIEPDKFRPNVITDGQVQVLRSDGGPISTRITKNISTNRGSSLRRVWITLNDPTCPLLINDIGINTYYVQGTLGEDFNFDCIGSLLPLEPIAAYKIYHELYDVFGNHMKTLENMEISDFSDQMMIPTRGSWRSYGNEIWEYFTCVSYVRSVRTQEGRVWNCDFKELAIAIRAVNIRHEFRYLPESDLMRLEPKGEEK